MLFRTIAIAAAFAVAASAAEAADKFTSTSQQEPPTLLLMPAVGPTPEARAAYFKGTIAATFADGVRNSTYECVGYPGNNANLSICQGKEGENTFSFRVTCPQGAGACFGTLMGTGGRYKGRTGSFVQTPAGQGKTESQGSWH
jgi:hypothetical protein